MAAEAGAALSGMEFSSQYATAPKPSALNKGLPFAWASFYREDGTRLETEGRDRYLWSPRRCSKGRSMRNTTRRGRICRNGCARASRIVFCRSTAALSIPFAERWPVTLRCEGTVRGVGGIKLVGDDCATGVPGLYAAGDAASRERLTGAISGGGGPNSSWAIASGQLGRASRRFICARRAARHSDRRAVPLGRAGLRPSAELRDRYLPGQEFVQVVREEMLPLDRNFFRSAPVMAGVAGTVGCELVGAELASARRGRGSGKGARSRGADCDQPVGLPQRAGSRREPRDAPAARSARDRPGLRLPVRGQRARQRADCAPQPVPWESSGMIEIVSETPLHRVRHLRQGLPGQCFRPGARGAAGHCAAERLPDLFSVRDLLSDRRALCRARTPRGRPRSPRRKSKRAGCSAAIAGVRLAPRQARRDRQ